MPKNLENTPRKAVAVGINHVALEVGNIEEALDFYGRFLDFQIESQSETSAFIYFGDQFINFMTGRTQAADSGRHFGIAVDDKTLARETLLEMGVEFLALDSKFLDFLDPWGNRVEITTYRNIQFSKADHVLKGMGLEHIKKTDGAITELKKKGMAPASENS
ncbi:MAG: VOC family protein [Acidiferrobacterales bacterium]|nr:VOC family protein [Acidiferrobacterales bacterium]